MKNFNLPIAVAALITINIFSFLVLPTTSHAARNQEKARMEREQFKAQREMDALMGQMSALQAQAQSANRAMQSGASSAAVPERVEYVFTSDLTTGSSGPDVIALQQFLISKGLLEWPEGTPLGQFEKLTRSALVKYQEANAIVPAEGDFGPLTRERVNAQIAEQIPYGSLSIISPLRNDYWQPNMSQTITWSTMGPIDTVSLSAIPVAEECESTSTSTCPVIDATPIVIAENINNENMYQWDNTQTLGLNNHYAISITGYGKDQQGQEVQIANTQSGAFLISTSTEPRLTTTGNLTDARQNVWYSQIINTEGFNDQLRWMVASGTLPVGLSVSRNAVNCPATEPFANCDSLETYQGVIAGVPTTPGTYEFSLSASDGVHTAKKRFTLVVRP